MRSCGVVAGGLLGRWSHWASLIEAALAAGAIALIVAGPDMALWRLLELRPILWLGALSYSLHTSEVLSGLVAG
ncbi:MAG TPA: hypothetical protein VL049_30185 [Candidatus Dormibacteraeota bacterium]|nr:hypothetical protein [Candidatus Dormibacteraeota bacterium]